ncbi:MATE efflux family protein [Forsythia ovata]|uniref:Protein DETOXIFICATION n=1 Tax=Forsythia ovata TaxID=205694 RepID=A0ABD1WKW9_9LAMI
MCQLTSSPVSSNAQETDMFSSLIPKTPTFQQQTNQTKNKKPYKITHFSLVIQEANSIAKIALPMIITGLFLYSRSIISMLFLGRLGDLALAGGSLALGFANITGYSILSGLAMGMEPICGQAFGAKKYTLLGLTLQRTVLLLIFTSFPISLLWLNMRKILLFCGQDESISTHAQAYLFYSLPDLFMQSLLHPLRIYLRTQSITLPLTICAALSILLHMPINYLLVSYLNLGIKVNPKATVASMGILIQTTALIYIFPSSLSFSVSTRVGNELGGGRPAKAKIAAIVGLSGSFILGFSALFFAVSVRNIWATMFTNDKEIIAYTSLVLPIIGLCELGNCPQTTGCGVLRGTARPKVGANINLGCFYLVGMPVAVGLVFFFGFDFEGLWLGLLAAEATCMATMMVVLLLTDWEFEAQRAKELTAGAAILDESDEIEENKQLKLADNKEDCLC